MSEDLERAWLKACQRLFEQQLQWGPIAQWSQRDFENLSELINERTGVMISVTTLKRALGRVAFQGLPYQSTLNAMVQYLGYPDWARFKADPEVLRQQKPADSLPEQPAPATLPAAKASLWQRLILWGSVTLNLLLLGLVSYLWLLPKYAPKVGGIQDAWIRSTDAVADSIPHEVHFEYFIPKVFHKDAVIISFSDNVGISYLKNEGSGQGKISHKFSDYGYFATKIFANKRLIASTPVLLVTPHWLVRCSVNGKQMPVNVKLALRQGVLTVAEQELKPHLKDTLNSISTQFRQFRNYGLNGDDCKIQFRLRCQPSNLNSQLPKVNFKIYGEHESMHLTLDKSSTAKDIFFKVANHHISVEKQLKLFVQDVSDWSLVTLITHNGHFKYMLNEKVLYEGDYQDKIGQIYGLLANFRGVGEIDQVHLYDGKGKLVYRDEF